MDSGMGEFLAVLRKSKGYTQQEVAAQLGVSNKTVSSWETGASCPDISMLPVLAELYGVTCDEIIRGRRITCAEDDKTAEKKRKKALARLIAKHRADLATVCWACGALTAMGVILATVLAFALSESLLGFIFGTVLLAASVCVCAAAVKRIRFAVGEEDLCESIARLYAALTKAQLGIVLANVVTFGFILPLAAAPLHAAANVQNALAYGLAYAAVLFAAGFTAVYLLGRRATAKACAAGSAKSGAAQRVLIPLFAFVLAAGCTAVGFTQTTAPDGSGPASYSFDTYDEAQAFMQGTESPFLSYPHILIEEERPETENETGTYAKTYLFPLFPERWKEYYRTEQTDEGTLVTVYMYRVKTRHPMDGVEHGYIGFSIYSFDALAPETQGGMEKLEVLRLYESGASSLSPQVYEVYNIDVAGSLPYRRARYRMYALIGAECALAAGCIVLLTACNVKRKKRSRARESGDAQTNETPTEQR